MSRKRKLPTRYWTPKGVRRHLPKKGEIQDLAAYAKQTGWEPEHWGPPGAWIHNGLVWYGPGRNRATTIEWDGLGAYVVCDYRRLRVNPPNVLRTCKYVAGALLEAALEGHPLASILEDPPYTDRVMSVAVGLGIALIGYWGGEERWVDTLP